MGNGIRKVVGISLATALFLLPGCGGGGGGGGGGGTTVSGSTLAVTSTSPADGDTGVATGSTVSATFNAALNPATVSNSVLTLRVSSSGSSVPGSVSYNDAGKTLIFTPSSSLSRGTTYTATVTTGVKDLSGNSLPVPKSWSFTTVTTGSGGGGGEF